MPAGAEALGKSGDANLRGVRDRRASLREQATLLSPETLVIGGLSCLRPMLVDLVDLADSRSPGPGERRLAAGHPIARSCSSIQLVPNRSRSIAKRWAKKVSSIFMKICPPSTSSAYTRSASSLLDSRSVR